MPSTDAVEPSASSDRGRACCFTLNLNGVEAFAITGPEQLGDKLSLVTHNQLEFAVLDASDGSYLQTLRVDTRLVVEWRLVLADGFRHYKLLAPGTRSDRKVPHGSEAELLTLAQVEEAFRQFMLGGRVGAPFVLEDISTAFE